MKPASPSLRRCAPVVVLLLSLSLLLSACDALRVDEAERAEVTVMTRNLYLGGDLFVLLEAESPLEVPQLAGQLYRQIQSTRFSERAGAIAREIEATRPHLIALQEVSLYREGPSDFLGNPMPNAADTTMDFLAILQEALAERGLSYRVAGQVENADVEVPTEAPQGLIDVRLTDRDVILVREGVQTRDAETANYTARLPVSVGLGEFSFVRGYVAVEAQVDGVAFTFANTHLEVGTSDEAAAVQEQQARELLGVLAGESGPVVLAGDFNSAAGAPADSTTASYGLLTESYHDAWSAVRSGEGITCCQAADLMNTAPFPLQQERIDLILYRGLVEPVSAQRVGAAPEDRTSSGLWPSDHAGVVATLRIEN